MVCVYCIAFVTKAKANQNRHYTTATLCTCKSSMRLYQHCQRSVGRETACPAATPAPGTAVAPLCMQHSSVDNHRDYRCLGATSQVMLPVSDSAGVVSVYGLLSDCSAVSTTHEPCKTRKKWLFSSHNGSLLRRPPGAVTHAYSACQL